VHGERQPARIHEQFATIYAAGALAIAFGMLPWDRSAMASLAGAHEPQELASTAYRLYEEFRPAIPSGVRGWGAKGRLDLDHIRAMADEVKQGSPAIGDGCNP
jgi:hypothetical protein